jgi:hypothetical protein
MLVMYLCVRVINAGLVFVCEEYGCLSCICVIGVSMLFMHLCVRGIDVGHVSVFEGYVCWSSICVIRV